MSISYEEAVQIVLEHFEPRWTYGSFYLDDKEIVETKDLYIFKVGAREYLLHGDPSFFVAGGVPVVFKESGELGSLPSVAVATDPTVSVRENPRPIFTINESMAGSTAHALRHQMIYDSNMHYAADGIDNSVWQVLRDAVAAVRSRNPRGLRETIIQFDSFEDAIKEHSIKTAYVYLTFFVGKQLWHLSPDSLTTATIRQVAERIYPDFSKFCYYNVDGLTEFLLAAFGKSEYASTLDAGQLTVLLAVAFGLLIEDDEDVEAAMNRMRPGLSEWCAGQGY